MDVVVNKEKEYLEIPEQLIVSYQVNDKIFELSGTELQFLLRCVSGMSMNCIQKELGLSSERLKNVQKSVYCKLFVFKKK